MFPQVSSPARRCAPTRHDRSALEKRPAHQLRDLFAHDRERFGRREVRLRDDYQTVSDSERAQDFHVLPRLRHDALVRRDQEHRQVDPARARDHLAHEALVAGDVDDADEHVGGERQRREPELDRDAALFLFFEAIGVVAGECFDQFGLAVVDVPRP